MIIGKKLEFRNTGIGMYHVAHDLGIGDGWKLCLDFDFLNQIMATKPRERIEFTAQLESFETDDPTWGPGNRTYELLKKMEK